MRFPGELKFPDLDHPGVPVDFHVDGNQAEIKLEGESLGKWSLYDVRADRLIASAFLVRLGEEEITFVADDPIDFAYRGVEHMASVWAGMKARRMGSRGIAVSRSRKGTVASRLGEVRQAMEDNLGQKPLAGEPAMPAETAVADAPQVETATPANWDERDQIAEIPAIGDAPPPSEEPAAPVPADPALTEEQRRLEEERRRLEEERAELERQRAEAEQREANLFEAYRLEVQRLEEEREELRRQAAAAAERAAQSAEPVPAEPEPSAEAGPFAEAEPEVETPVAHEAGVSSEPEAEPALVEEPEEEPALAEEEPEEEPADVPEPSVLDLNEYEGGKDEQPPPPPPPSAPPPPPAPSPPPAPDRAPQPKPEPALAGASPKEKGGLMGAVRAAFRGGAKDHEHQFTEAPGGLGIVRYVCEECGYVSISVGG